MNRGIARRTVFEGRADCEAFLDFIGEAVERGDLEVHAYALMATHFHLLGRSPRGRMSEAMRRAQLSYVRCFNRRRRRDGPLFRGRFRSRPVDSMAYRRVLVSYIDSNPVAAGIVARPEHYPYGSARGYLLGDGPAWLCRDWVESEVRAASGRESFHPNEYSYRFPPKLPESVREWVERRIERGAPAPEDDFEHLLGAAPAKIREWAVRKAMLADGTTPGEPVFPVDLVTGAVTSRIPLLAAPTLNGRRQLPNLLLAGVLRDLCGLTYDEIADRLGRRRSTVVDDVRIHHGLMQDPPYADFVASLVGFLLERLATGRHGP